MLSPPHMTSASSLQALCTCQPVGHRAGAWLLTRYPAPWAALQGKPAASPDCLTGQAWAGKLSQSSPGTYQLPRACWDSKPHPHPAHGSNTQPSTEQARPSVLPGVCSAKHSGQRHPTQTPTLPKRPGCTPLGQTPRTPGTHAHPSLSPACQGPREGDERKAAGARWTECPTMDGQVQPSQAADAIGGSRA